jgi:hypothetical protein
VECEKTGCLLIKPALTCQIAGSLNGEVASADKRHFFGFKTSNGNVISDSDYFGQQHHDGLHALPMKSTIELARKIPNVKVLMDDSDSTRQGSIRPGN